MTRLNPLGYLPPYLAERKVNVGDLICERLRVIYYPTRRRCDVYREIIKKFTFLKRIAKTYYPHYETEEEMLQEIHKWPEEDIKNAIELLNVR